MTIILENNVSTQVIFWSRFTQELNYKMIVRRKDVTDVFSVDLENISNNIEMYAMFNIVVTDTNDPVPGANVLFLPLKGEYIYELYAGLTTQDDSTLVGTGLLINKTDNITEIVYTNSNNPIVYGE